MNKDQDGIKCEKCGKFYPFLIPVKSMEQWNKTRSFDVEWCMMCCLSKNES